jgi:opacity protein-like surface antigen
MKYKIILLISFISFTSTSSYSEEIKNPSTRTSGWYSGVSAGIVNSGGSIQISKEYKNKIYDADTKDSPIILKIGYVTEKENRVEAYYKKDSIGDTTKEKAFSTSTFGLDYEWGLSSMSSEKILPYIRIGGGLGSASMKGSKLDLSAAEFDMGAGIHYAATNNIDISAGIYRRAIVVGEKNTTSSIGTAFNGIELGINYHFLNLENKSKNIN